MNIKNALWGAAIGVDKYTHLANLLRQPRLNEHPSLQGTSDAILMYHSVGDAYQYGNVSVERFRQDLRFLTDKYHIVDLSELFDSDGKNRVALTFDDGYRNFFENVVPLLHEFGVPATVFVTTGLIASKNEQLAKSVQIADQFSKDDVLTVDQLEHLVEDEYVRIGNHTHTHPRLPTIEDANVRRREIIGAKDTLESRYGVSISRFCYPFGEYDQNSLDLVKDTHELAVTTCLSVVGQAADPHQLPRISAHLPTERLSGWRPTEFRWKIRDIVKTGADYRRRARM